MIETTEAKIGRSMKKCEMRMRLIAAATWTVAAGLPLALGAAGFAPCSSGRTFCAGPRLHEAADDDAVVGADALLYDAQIVGRQLPERHVFLRARVLLVDDDDISARLLGADGRVRDQQRPRKAASRARARARTCPA